MTQSNFYPEQYSNDSLLSIQHNYLQNQFSDYQDVFAKIEKMLKTCDFTLGDEVDRFEKKFAMLAGTKYAVGVGSGTDALFLSLKLLGIEEGDEVITTPYTFFATIGAIVTAGAKPVFVDVKDDYNIDPAKIEKAITPKTKAILPVHWSGLICDMNEIREIANRHGLSIVEDACHAITATYNNEKAGSLSDLGCFSMHPLKNLNVWGDGGVITTNCKEYYENLLLLRNHGLKNRDECVVFSYNSRLDTLQAIVANHMIEKLGSLTEARINHAKYLDDHLSTISEITIPPRESNKKHVYHLYIVKAKNRDGLKEYLISKGIDAKIHYPIPMHLQPAAEKWGYKKGDFPVCEDICDNIISFPVHEFVNQNDLDYMVQSVKEFYTRS